MFCHASRAGKSCQLTYTPSLWTRSSTTHSVYAERELEPKEPVRQTAAQLVHDPSRSPWRQLPEPSRKPSPNRHRSYEIKQRPSPTKRNKPPRHSSLARQERRHVKAFDMQSKALTESITLNLICAKFLQCGRGMTLLQTRRLAWVIRASDIGCHQCLVFYL